MLGRCNSLDISTWLSDVRGPILPLHGLVAYRKNVYWVQSLISALVERMLWPGLSGQVHLNYPQRIGTRPNYPHDRGTRPAGEICAFLRFFLDNKYPIVPLTGFLVEKEPVRRIVRCHGPLSAPSESALSPLPSAQCVFGSSTINPSARAAILSSPSAETRVSADSPSGSPRTWTSTAVASCTAS